MKDYAEEHLYEDLKYEIVAWAKKNIVKHLPENNGYYNDVSWDQVWKETLDSFAEKYRAEASCE